MSSKCFLLLQYVSLISVILFQLEPRVANSNNIISCLDEEKESLLAFKQGLIDESGILSSWGREDEKRNCCKWRGVRCSNKTGHVLGLDLRASSDSPVDALKGTINPSLLKLQHLTYLDLSWNNFSGSPIPEFIGSLGKLSELALSSAQFAGPIPHQLGNLSKLQVLDLRFNNLFSSGNLDWLSYLSSLRYLDLADCKLSKFSNWVQVLSNLRSLTNLYLGYCDLPPISTPSLLHINYSKSLEVIDLSNNYLTNSIYPWLFNVSSNLVDHIDLGSNQLHGSIPLAFGHMASLRHLDLLSNQLREVPKFLGNMSSLKRLVFSYNELRGELSEFIQNVSSGSTKNSSLEWLYLAFNEITGTIPDLGGFPSLQILSLENNRLTGTISKSIGQLSKLELLLLSGNSLRGVISEALFSNLSSLDTLQLSDNSLTLKFSHDWTPPFQLFNIFLGSCKIGPRFPKWLQSQNQTVALDVSNAGISDIVPDWFWDLTNQLYYLNLSNNEMKGKLPDLSRKFDSYGPGIDVSSNQFDGPIPLLPPNVSSLNLSKNKFSGSISFLCSISSHLLTYLDLSNNLLSGRLPDCWFQFDSLAILNLANNSFFGEIPDSMSFLRSIGSLSLYNNSLSGGLPSFFMNGSQLTLMDLGKNGLSGEIPTWIGESLPNLVVLSLRSNKFHGNIPFQLCYLSHIQILDLSLNNISGIIPKCFHNFTAMTKEKSSNLSIISNYYYNLGLRGMLMPLIFFDTWKGGQYEYKSILGLIKIIDLSSNKLGGKVLEEIMDLVGLVALNLSNNNLTGQITPRIGQLKSLDFLDLSRNHFFGGIPSSLSRLRLLSVMDLSYNNFSGKIPKGTQLQRFGASTYAGNPELCGLPLPNKCLDEESAPSPSRDDAYYTPDDDGDQFITLGFYMSMILGFFVGFWGVCGTLLVKSSWRHGYYNFLTRVKDWLYVEAVVNIAKLQRRIQAAPEVHGWHSLDQSKLLLLVYLRKILLIRTFSNLSPCETVPAEQNSPQATMDASVPSVPDLCSFLNAFPAA
ncbi:hypothetical protein CISIN_1g047190mg [Citrus sinensis]|uniref:Leucine-rich repeat-containing N-terminal plant-type domain-containing protein n=1 Tax=Citrus sinensis TaxID=2711 RepID=A0A067DRP3_CITSI|nr:hypothetical protein CISIN_1g047190mg [Citrus sinensis]